MTRRSGGFRGAKPTWTTTSTSGVFGMEDVVDLKAAGQWPRGPVAPTSLAGTGGDQQVALTWVAPATTHGTITDYVVEYTPAAGSPTVVATGSTAASYTLTGLTNDTEYTFRVAAVNHTRGDWSDSVAVTPAINDFWTLDSPTYEQSFSVASQETTPTDVFFKPDGTKMYVLGDIGQDVNEYDLSTAWDISTASYAQNFSVSSQGASPYGFFFKPDGTKMYVSNTTDDEVNEYSLSAAWDISTASYVQNFSVASQENAPRNIYFGADGAKMYVIGTGGQEVNEYSLSAAWDISTASYVQNFSVSAQDTSPRGLFFKSDGTKMYVVGHIGDDVNEYDLSTAWDISTASYVQNFSVASQETGPLGIFFKPDGSKMYVIGNVADSVIEYSL